MKRLIYLFVILFSFLCLLSFDSGLSYNEDFVDKHTSWHYVSNTNKNTGVITKIAQIVSLNEVTLTQKEEVRARVMLVVSNKGKSMAANRIGFYLLRGNYGTECTGFKEGACFVYVTFDDEPSMPMSVWVVNGKASHALLLRQSNQFLTKLKKAKRMKVVFKFADNGSAEFVFDVSGFKWVLYEDIGI